MFFLNLNGTFIIFKPLKIEGNPAERKFVELVIRVKPAQVTLVPDALGALTSNAGRDTIKHAARLADLINEFKSVNIRGSVFIDPDPKMAEGARVAGADRVELYLTRHTTSQISKRQLQLTPKLPNKWPKASTQATILRYFQQNVNPSTRCLLATLCLLWLRKQHSEARTKQRGIEKKMRCALSDVENWPS